MFPCFPFLTSYIISDTDCFFDQRLIEEENMLAPSLKQFSLRVETLPSYIPVRVAEKILFVGESVQMFENQNVNLTRKGRNLLAQPYPILKGLFDAVWPQSLPGQSGWLLTFMCWDFSTAVSDMLNWEAGEIAVALGWETLACAGSLSSFDSAFLFCRIHFEKPGGHFCCRAASSQAATPLQPGGLWAGGGSYT